MSSITHELTPNLVRDLARECGFSLAGIAKAGPVADFGRFEGWTKRGLGGEMRYLTDHRGEIRANPTNLLPGCRSIICTGLVYNGPEPYSTGFSDSERAWISRYAWGDDYHGIIRGKLEALAGKLSRYCDFSWRACVDTAPLLERSLARDAGLGWIGKNTCLINQAAGSWFFLGELLTTLDLPAGHPAPDRCGTCTRCIEACPTAAIVPADEGRYELDARRCISYFTIELRSAIPQEYRSATGNHVFGCDICQDVCPWNRRAAETKVEAFHPRHEPAPRLDRMAGLSESEFREMFRGTPVTRAKYSGFLRNVAVAMGNAGSPEFREPLERLAESGDALVTEHARWALSQLMPGLETPRL